MKICKTVAKTSPKNTSLALQYQKLSQRLKFVAFLTRNYCNPINSTTTGEDPGRQRRFIRYTI